MNTGQLRKALTRCAEVLHEAGYDPVRTDGKTPREMLERAHWCAVEAKGFVASNQDKAMRWLGFCQGVLYAHSGLTIDDLRGMSVEEELA